MKEEIKAEFKRKILTSKTFLFFLLLILIWSVLISIRVTYKKYQMNKEIGELKKEIEKLQQKNQDLVALIKSSNDQTFLEEEARRRFNLKREGEEVVILLKPETAENNQSSEQNLGPSEVKPNLEAEKKESNPSLETNEESNLSKWWRYFFKN